ncbi:sulfate transporter [Sphaerisporangium siamense]|uniref:MFS superfamily sulfate permease-like transporter n=1 Tax=Sphaerisporangium siamense TaxID=795645 RepID=A0A7W7DD07_9ACTN|nr:SulP family inorganic anion transporter [Sphaerisporangium siamense]MBB4704562.1 MFS superfamily sulfate permease-like transporter [Sphaerisporangium siamense]GII86175.1 sulfate transporter [Sphaerisporangium siamense]
MNASPSFQHDSGPPPKNQTASRNPAETHPAKTGRSLRPHLRADLTASLVVFLVALPLCVGIAVASGAPPELGLITGIVGGLVTGLLPGSSLQVSGPAAGLTVLVYEAVREYGLATLGVIVLAAGLIQVTLGALRLGRWFRAISVAVVEGMLAGIGLVIIAGQLYSMADRQAPASGLEKIIALPGTLVGAAGSAQALASLAVGAGVIVVMACWRFLPSKVRVVPGALAAVLLAIAATALLDLPIDRIQVTGLLDAISLLGAEDLGRLADVGVMGTVVAFTLIASAESLFSAAAVDRLHTGPGTDYDKELMAQGAGNTVCGLLGALPLTAVIVRSATNVYAGAKTKASRVWHGVWLLLFTALLPGALGVIPIAALAGVLVYSGWKLLPIRQLAPLWRDHRGEALILLVTAVAIVTVSMFEGVLIGIALSICKTAWETSHLHVSVSDADRGSVRVALTGNATFLRLPKMLEALEALPKNRPIELDLSGLRHLDHACRTALTSWAERHNHNDVAPVRISATA